MPESTHPRARVDKFPPLLVSLFSLRLILLNKLLEDGNTLYKKGRLVDAAVRYSYAAKRVPITQDCHHQPVFLQLRVHLLLNLSRCRNIYYTLY